MVTDARVLNIVTELLQNGHGEISVLKKIKRAAVQDEVISLNERRYVESLAGKFLRAKQVQKKTMAENAPKPVLLPEKSSLLQNMKPQTHKAAPGTRLRSRPGKKILIVMVAIAIIIASGAAAANYADLNFSSLTKPQPQADTVAGLSIDTDSTTYNIGEIISVSGRADGDVKLSVLDSSYGIIWFEQVSVTDSGEYSALIIVDGDGWEKGSYSVMASFGAESESVAITIV